MRRRSGVTIPLFSIRRADRGWGIGEIPDLAAFARWAARAGFQVVQILPVNEPAGGQNSPYGARSAFAIDAAYVSMADVSDFVAAGGLAALSAEQRATVEAVRGAPKVRWDDVRGLKIAALGIAYRHFVTHELERDTERARAFEAFAEAEGDWLDDYALFSVIHDEQGSVAWNEWSPPLRYREASALDAARVRHAVRINERRYVQWIAVEQWHAARAACKEVGVDVMGDLPFLVAGDSADIWARAHEFRLDLRCGVPPDAFSEDGQDWGLPVFSWSTIAAGDFAWMHQRARHAADLFGLFRVDHVVGLYRTFYRPQEAPHNGPGKFTPETEPQQIALGETIMKILDGGEGRVIAEDLGVVPDFVRASLARLGIPGYRVLRWEKDKDVYRDPAKWPARSVGTTGTHDTESIADWYDALEEAERTALLAIPALAGLRQRAPREFDDEVRDALLEAVYRSTSELVLFPYQDLFGARERVNTPGTVNDENWTYRTPETVESLEEDAVETARLAALAAESDRR